MNGRKYLGGLLVLLCCLTLAAALRAGQAGADPLWELASSAWPTERHDFQRSGRSPHIGIQDGAHMVWYQPFGWVTSRSLTVGDDDLIYAKAHYGVGTYRFSPDGGLVEHIFPGGECLSTPTHLANDRIYYASTLSWVGVDSSGHVFWEFYFPNGCFHFTPAVTQGGIGYFLYNAQIFAIDLATHNLLWLHPTGGWTAMALGHDDTLYVSGLYGSLLALRPDGTVAWERKDFPVSGHLYQTDHMTIGDDGTLYTPRFKDANLDGTPDDGYYTVRALTAGGTPLWDFQLLDSGHVVCGMANSAAGTVYLTSSDYDHPASRLYALSSNGDLLWSRVIPADRACGGPITDSAGSVYLCAGNARCYGYDQAGTLLWDIWLWANNDAEPLIYADRQMYISTGEGVSALTEGDLAPRASLMPLVTAP